MANFGWRLFQIGVVALFMYADWDANLSNGKPGIALFVGVVTAFGLTAILTATFDGIRSLVRKLRRRPKEHLGDGALVPRSGSSNLTDTR